MYTLGIIVVLFAVLIAECLHGLVVFHRGSRGGEENVSLASILMIRFGVSVGAGLHWTIASSLIKHLVPLITHMSENMYHFFLLEG